MKYQIPIIEKTQLMVIDVQNDFINPSGALYVPNAETLKPKIADAITKAKESGIGVIFTQDCHDGEEPEMKNNGGLFPLHCINGTEGQKNITEATPDNFNRVFLKRCYDVFDKKLGNKRIEYWLKDDVNKIIMCGLVGNICLEAAAIGLRKLNIEVVVLEDVVVWMDLEKGIFSNGEPDNKEKSIQRMKDAGVNFSTLAETFIPKTTIPVDVETIVQGEMK